MSRNTGMYDHLPPVPLQVDLDFNKLADTLVKANYGVHRMLSAIVRARRRDRTRKEDPLIDMIERALEEGKS